jgi:hypothetical protein
MAQRRSARGIIGSAGRVTLDTRGIKAAFLVAQAVAERSQRFGATTQATVSSAV